VDVSILILAVYEVTSELWKFETDRLMAGFERESVYYMKQSCYREADGYAARRLHGKVSASTEEKQISYSLTLRTLLHH
jgi:hypothetical protein